MSRGEGDWIDAVNQAAEEVSTTAPFSRDPLLGYSLAMLLRRKPIEDKLKSAKDSFDRMNLQHELDKFDERYMPWNLGIYGPKPRLPKLEVPYGYHN
jgi:hypothetical protein